MGQGERGEKEKINKRNSFSFRLNERNEILECGHNCQNMYIYIYIKVYISSDC